MRTSLLPPARPTRLSAVNPLGRMVWDAGARRRFEPDDVPDEDLWTMLTLAAQAPSSFNLQPWRFAVVREPEQRERLSRIVYDSRTVREASVVVAVCGLRAAWPEYAGKVAATAVPFAIAGESVAPSACGVADSYAKRPDVWLARHTMVAFTYLMIAAEALGWNTAPMERFDARAVRAVLGLPDDCEVVALLAIGHLEHERNGGEDDALGEMDRLPLEQLVISERPIAS